MPPLLALERSGSSGSQESPPKVAQLSWLTAAEQQPHAHEAPRASTPASPRAEIALEGCTTLNSISSEELDASTGAGDAAGGARRSTFGSFWRAVLAPFNALSSLDTLCLMPRQGKSSGHSSVGHSPVGDLATRGKSPSYLGSFRL